MTDPNSRRDDRIETSGPSSDWTGQETPAKGYPSVDAGFTPGTMLASRFRIVALLGRGGMGEVYRADDVKLGQPVALKFVRGALSPALLQRLYAEVRIGRQVAHPSVCRLYDVYEIEGETFLAMEYVDGEDLASLLARIGRLPGHGESADAASAFEWDQAYIQYMAQQDPTSQRWGVIREGAIPSLHFFYRQSPRKLIAANRDGMVLRNDPPADVSGMTEVVLDPQGRMTSFQAVPPQMEEPRAAWPEPDWSPLFEEAGLLPADFRSAPPQWAAPVDSDRKAAWQDAYPGAPEVAVRIEAAAYHGRPVWFAVLPPWDGPSRMPGGPPSPQTPVGQVSVLILALAMPLGGFLLARRNLRLGRGDRKGAFRVALFIFATYSLARLFRADHVSSFGDELWILIRVFAYPSLWALQVWLLYMALEPYARRRFPHVLIAWKRLLAGRLRDPLVGRDILLGCAAGVAMLILFIAGIQAGVRLGFVPSMPGPLTHGVTLAHMKQVGFRLFVNQFSAVLFAMTFLFMLVLLRMLLRKQWLAAALWCLFVGGPLVGEHPTFGWASGLVRASFMLFVLTRGGLLMLATALFVLFVVFEVPVTLDVTAWYASRAWPVLMSIGLLAAYGFHVSLGGKPILGRSLLED